MVSAVRRVRLAMPLSDHNALRMTSSDHLDCQNPGTLSISHEFLGPSEAIASRIMILGLPCALIHVLQRHTCTPE